MVSKIEHLNTRRKSRIGISAIIIVIWVAINFLLFYPDHSGLGSLFAVSVMYIITAHTMLIAGSLILLMRFVKLLRFGDSLLGILCMQTNLLAGTFSVILYLTGNIDATWLHRGLFNLLVGFLCLLIVYFSKYRLRIEKCVVIASKIKITTLKKNPANTSAGFFHYQCYFAKNLFPFQNTRWVCHGRTCP